MFISKMVYVNTWVSAFFAEVQEKHYELINWIHFFFALQTGNGDMIFWDALKECSKVWCLNA